MRNYCTKISFLLLIAVKSLLVSAALYEEESELEISTPFTLLEEVIANDDVPITVKVLKDHFASDINAHNESGFTALHLAAIHGAKRVADYLLSHNANISAEAMFTREQPIHTATWRHQADIVRLLLEHSRFADVRQRLIASVDGSGRTALCIAAQIGNIHIARHLLQANDRPRKEAIFDETSCPYGSPQRIGNPLHVAVIFNQASFVGFLLQTARKRLLKSVDSAKSTPLHVAAYREGQIFKPFQQRQQAYPVLHDSLPPNPRDNVAGPLVVSLFIGAMQDAPGDTIGSLLLAKGASLEAADEEGRTPFLTAASAGAVLYARFLQSNGANVSAVDTFGFNAFHVTSDTRIMAFLTELVMLKQLKHDINSKSSPCNECSLSPGSLTPLQVAILERKPVEVVRFLLQHNALIEIPNDFGDTAVHLAVKTNNTEALELLFEKPSAIEMLARPDSYGKKPLQAAVEQGNLEMVRILLRAIINNEIDEHETVIDFLDDLSDGSRSSLREAVVRKNYHAFKMVFEKEEEDALDIDQHFQQLHDFVMSDDVSRTSEILTYYFRDDVNVQNLTGYSLLHIAALYDAVRVGEFLLNHKANLTATNENGELPIHLAILGNSYRVLDLMFEYDGADAIIEAEQTEGETPIFYAGRSFGPSSKNRPFAAAEKLLEHLANVEHTNNRGMQPIHEAVLANRREFAEFLVQHGAKLTAKCCPPDGKTAFHLAAENDVADVFDGFLFDFLNETIVADNYEHAPICVAASAGSVKFARKLFEFSKKDGAIEEQTQPCLYPASFKLQDTGDPIHIAASSNQLDFVKFLVEIGGTKMALQSADSAGRSLLHVMAFAPQSNSSTELSSFLIEKGADLEANDLRGRTPFLFAIERSAVKYAEFLQSRGADLSAFDANGYTAFHLANDGETVNWLLEQAGVGSIQHNINTKSARCRQLPLPTEQCLAKSRLTPLHVAVLEGKRPNFVRFLLNQNADPTAKNGFNQTAFHLAVKYGQTEILNALLKKLGSVAILAALDKNGDTALNLAVKTSNYTAIKAIMTAFDPLNVTSMFSGDGLTPLHQAVINGDVQAIQHLLENGAKITNVDAFGRSTLRFAVRQDMTENDLKLFQTLLPFAANESAFDVGDRANGDTALHKAVSLGLGKLAGLLLANGASCSIRNRQGVTPLHMAISDGFGEMAKRLLKYPSCNPLTVTDISGLSIFEYGPMRQFSSAFVEETLLSREVNCKVLARKIQLAFKLGSMHYAEVLLQTMGESACGTNAEAINQLNSDGYSAFHTALILGSMEAVNWCFQHGASIAKRAANGRSAINLALFGPSMGQVVQFVASVTRTLGNDPRVTCLNADHNDVKAASLNRRDLVRLLVEKDGLLAENCIDGDNSNTPLHYLASLGDFKMVNEIVANGRINVDINAANKDGLTALHLAALANGQDAVNVMQILLDYGGDPSFATTTFVTDDGDSNMLPLHIAASRCGNVDTIDPLIYHVIHQFERNSAVNFLLRVSTKLGETAPRLAFDHHQVDLYMRMIEVFEYFRSWDKRPAKSLFTEPNVRAIIPLPSARQAIVVSYNGDILGISTDCESVLWRSKVYPPKEFISDYQGIYHAAFDSITKHVYFTFHHPMREAGIFYTTLQKLTEETNDVILDALMPPNGIKNNQFLALYVDAERETILANDPWVNHNIAAYSLADGRFLNRSTVYSPTSIERFEPLFCTLSRPSPPVANIDSGPRLLAVSDHNHRVHLFKRKPDGPESLETTYVSTIAEEDKVNPSRLGAVFYPADLTFDHLGNLFVADCLNRRLQIFAAADLRDATSLRSVWASEKLRSEVQRIAVAVNKNFEATALVGLESGHVLCFKHSHRF